jgi:MFS family permease
MTGDNPTGDKPSDKPLGLVITAVILGTVLNPLDGSMTALALPSMSGDLGVAGSTVLWAMTLYYLASMAAQPVMGTLADNFPPRRVLVTGLAVTAVSCAGIALSRDITLVLFFRVLQAVGSSAAFPAGLVIVRRACAARGDSPDRPVSVITWVNSLAAAIGPLVAGVLVTVVGWRGPSMLSLVLAVAALVISLIVLRGDSGATRRTPAARNVDMPGILLFVVVVGVLQLILSGVTLGPWAVLPVVLVVAAAALVAVERRSSAPFFAPRIFRYRQVGVILCVYGAANLVFFLVLTGLPTWLQDHRGLTPVGSGVATFPIAVCGVAATLLFSRFVFAGRQRAVAAAALTVVALGSVAMLVGGTSVAVAVVAVFGVLMGSPNNIITLSLQTWLYRVIDDRDTGMATGLFQTFRYLGATSATTIVALTVAAGDSVASVRSLSLWCLGAAGAALMAVGVVSAYLRKGR